VVEEGCGDDRRTAMKGRETSGALKEKPEESTTTSARRNVTSGEERELCYGRVLKRKNRGKKKGLTPRGTGLPGKVKGLAMRRGFVGGEIGRGTVRSEGIKGGILSKPQGINNAPCRIAGQWAQLGG